MRFSIVIPTYNRQADLEDCLNSIWRQTVRPDEILIVDDGEIPTEWVLAMKNRAAEYGISLVYHRKNHARERRGLSESKNLALNLVANDFLMIDDDIVLEPDFIERIERAWNETDDPELLGVGGMIKNIRPRGRMEAVFHKIFGLSSHIPWDVTDAGFQVWDEGIEERTKGYYAHGGLCSYKKDLAKTLPFSTFAGGRTGLEDVDHCLGAKQQGYHFVIEPKARAFHKGSAIAREDEWTIGLKESQNRKEIFQRRCAKSLENRLRFVWSNIGWILRQFLAGHLNKGLGMIRGLL